MLEKNIKQVAKMFTLVKSKGFQRNFSACSKVITWILSVQEGGVPLAMELYRSRIE